MSEKLFFDSHMHAFNLSHPSFSAFVRRFAREAFHSLATRFRIPLCIARLVGLVAMPLLCLVFGLAWFAFVAVYIFPCLRRGVRVLITRLFLRVTKLLKASANLLVVLENDIGSTFLLMENCLRDRENPILNKGGLHIGGETYRRIVLTPLMMDFGYKGNRPLGGGRVRRFHYDMRVGKPIVGQVVDVFRAIRMYVETESTPDLTDKFPSLHRGTRRVFEIYPFLGLNPANYSLQEVSDLLTKHFGFYTGRRADFLAVMGNFDGNIDHLGAHAFAGIKVYPPLGFDPWPEGDAEAMAKVELVYETCSSKGIPITTHGGKGGFVVVDATQLNTIASVSKWACVLKRYPDLKLNLAHFPMDWPERGRRQETLALVLEYASVYVDISCRATSEVYYRRLKALFDSLPLMDLEVLQPHILFGSDFAVNLIQIESYNKYLDLFSRTSSLTPQEKNLFCSTNPARFLFHDSP